MNLQSVTLADGTIKDWYLGTKYFSLEYYLLLIQRFIQELGGGLLLFLLGFLYLWKTKNIYYRLVVIWLINILLYLVIFNNLNFVHNYYQLPVYPAITVIIVFGFIYLKRKTTNFHIYRSILFICLITYYFYSFSIERKSYASDVQLTKRVMAISDVVEQCTEEKDKIIYVWPYADPNHPTVLYYARRIGYNHDLFELDKIGEILKQDKDVHNIVIYPVSENFKTDIINYLNKVKINISEKCFVNDTLILEVI